MSTSSRTLPVWAELLSAAALGLLITALAWSGATSEPARFLLGVLVGLSTAALVAGVVSLVNARGGWRAAGSRGGHP